MRFIILLSIFTFTFFGCGTSTPHPISHDARIVIDLTAGSNLDFVEIFHFKDTGYVAIGQIKLNSSFPSKHIFIQKNAILEHPKTTSYKAVYHQFGGNGSADISAGLKVVIEDESESVVSSNLGHLFEQEVIILVL